MQLGDAPWRDGLDLSFALNRSLRSGSGHVPLESRGIMALPCTRAKRVVHGAGGGIRTPTGLPHEILSLTRLPGSATPAVLLPPSPCVVFPSGVRRKRIEAPHGASPSYLGGRQGLEP